MKESTPNKIDTEALLRGAEAFEKYAEALGTMGNLSTGRLLDLDGQGKDFLERATRRNKSKLPISIHTTFDSAQKKGFRGSSVVARHEELPLKPELFSRIFCITPISELFAGKSEEAIYCALAELPNHLEKEGEIRIREKNAVLEQNNLAALIEEAFFSNREMSLETREREGHTVFIARKDRYTLSEHEADAVIAAPRKIPFEARTLFGEKWVASFVELFQSSLFAELDKMILMGELTQNEAADYAIQLSEYSALITRLQNLHRELVEVLRKNPRYTIERSYDAQRHRMKPLENNRIQSVRTMLLKLYEATTIPYINTFTRRLADRFITDALILYFETLKDAALPEERPALEDLEERFNFSRADNPIADQRAQLLSALQYFEQETDNLSEETRDLPTLRAENERLLGEIDKLAYFRVVSHEDAVVETATYSAHLFDQEEEDRFTRTLEYCTTMFFTQKDEDNINSDHSLTVSMRRPDAELISFCSTFISLRDRISPLTYEKLKNVILGLFLEGLQNTPDILLPMHARSAEKKKDALMVQESAPVVAKPTPSAPQEPAIEVVEPRGITEAEKEAVKLKALRYHEEQAARKREQQRAPTEERADEEPSDARSEQKEMLRTLQNLSSDEIITAFTKVLGEPRCSASHRIFHNKNGVSYPLPAHGKKTIHIGILRRAFQKLGVGMDELLAATKKGRSGKREAA